MASASPLSVGELAPSEGLGLVLKALRAGGLDVVAIHHHMIGAKPMVIFLHYWGTGPEEKLAKGFHDALEQLGKGQGAHD